MGKLYLRPGFATPGDGIAAHVCKGMTVCSAAQTIVGAQISATPDVVDICIA